MTGGAPPRVVLLNGVGSVGKSSVARALQAITRAPFLHVPMDAFLEMLPEPRPGQPDGLVFEPVREDGRPSVAIRQGPVAERALKGMRHAVAALAGQGNELIVDEVLLGDAGAEYRRVLAGCRLYLVGLFAPLEVLEERERRRGDRLIGLARWQYPRVHAGLDYDLEIDTASAGPEACADRIRVTFDL